MECGDRQEQPTPCQERVPFSVSAACGLSARRPRCAPRPESEADGPPWAIEYPITEHTQPFGPDGVDCLFRGRKCGSSPAHSWIDLFLSETRPRKLQSASSMSTCQTIFGHGRLRYQTPATGSCARVKWEGTTASMILSTSGSIQSCVLWPMQAYFQRMVQFGSSIIPQEHRLHGANMVEIDHVGETYARAPAGSDFEIVVTTSSTSEDVKSKWEQTRTGSRELRCQGNLERELLVWKAALKGVGRCTCKAAAVLVITIRSHSAWSETPGQATIPAYTSPKVAVGLYDRTVHFIELNTGKG
jgi:hypothetical protein